MPVDCWIVLITTYKSIFYLCYDMLITTMLRSLNLVDKKTSYPQEKLSTTCDRSYRDLIQQLSWIKFSLNWAIKRSSESQ